MKVSTVRRAWRELQHEVTEHIRAYPLIPGLAPLAPGELVELHAAEMYGGHRRFRKANATDRTYLTQHHIWMEEALALMHDAGVLVTEVGFRKQDLISASEVHAALGPIATTLPRQTQRLVDVMSSFHLHALPNLLVRLDELFTAENLSYTVTLDRQRHRTLHVAETYEALRGHGLMSGLRGTPTAGESSNEPLLQMADLAAYVICGRYEGRIGGQRDHQLDVWAERYLDASGVDIPELTSRSLAAMASVATQVVRRESRSSQTLAATADRVSEIMAAATANPEVNLSALLELAASTVEADWPTDETAQGERLVELLEFMEQIGIPVAAYLHEVTQDGS